MLGRGLRKSWLVTRKHLAAARDVLSRESLDAPPVARDCLRHYEEYLDHNELELALDMLEEAVVDGTPPREFWEHLVLAARNMKLDDRADRLLQDIG